MWPNLSIISKIHKCVKASLDLPQTISNNFKNSDQVDN